MLIFIFGLCCDVWVFSLFIVMTNYFECTGYLPVVYQVVCLTDYIFLFALSYILFKYTHINIDKKNY